MISQSELDGWKQLCEKATKGKRQWFGNTRGQSIYLATVAFGRRFIMEFARWGMMNAQPMFQVYDQTGNGTMKKASELAQPDHNGNFMLDHPDAALIAATDPDAILGLIAEIEEARRVIQYYADRNTWDTYQEPVSGLIFNNHDRGQRARRFLGGEEGK